MLQCSANSERKKGILKVSERRRRKLIKLGSKTELNVKTNVRTTGNVGVGNCCDFELEGLATTGVYIDSGVYVLYKKTVYELWGVLNGRM